MGISSKKIWSVLLVVSIFLNCFTPQILAANKSNYDKIRRDYISVINKIQKIEKEPPKVKKESSSVGKWIVGGILAGAAIILTGGAATPAVVGGAAAYSVVAATTITIGGLAISSWLIGGLIVLALAGGYIYFKDKPTDDEITSTGGKIALEGEVARYIREKNLELTEAAKQIIRKEVDSNFAVLKQNSSTDSEFAQNMDNCAYEAVKYYYEG